MAKANGNKETKKGTAKPKPGAPNAGVTDVLRAPATRTRALAALSEALVSGKTLQSSSAATLSFVLELLDDPATEGRDQILSLASLMLHLGDPSTLQPTGMDLRVADIAARYATGPAHDVYSALVAAAPTLRRSLGDTSPLVRARAAAVLGFLFDGAKENAAALVERVLVEDNPEARAWMAFACMYLPRYDDALAAPIGSALQRLASDSSLDPRTRGAVAIARAFVEKRWGDDDAKRRELTAFFAAVIPSSLEGKSAYNAIPHNHGEIDNEALAVLGSPSLGSRGRVSATEAVIAALEVADLPSNARVLSDWTNWVLLWHFPERAGGKDSSFEDPLPAQTLTGDQRRALEGLSKIDAPPVVFGPTGLVQGATYVYRGLPNDVRARRRMLGVDTPGVLEQIAPCRAIERQDWPRWRTLTVALREYRSTNASIPMEQKPSLQSFVAPYFSGLSAPEWLELWTEVEAGAYGLSSPASPKPVPIVAAMDAVDPESRERWVRRYVEEILHSTDRQLGARIGPFVSIPLVRKLAEGETLSAEHETIIPLTRDLLASLPEGLRLPFLERRIAWARTQSSARRLMVFDQIGQRLLELVPEAARLILAELDNPENSAMSAQLHRALAQARSRVPRVDAILRDHEATAIKTSSIETSSTAKPLG